MTSDFPSLGAVSEDVVVVVVPWRSAAAVAAADNVWLLVAEVLKDAVAVNAELPASGVGS